MQNENINGCNCIIERSQDNKAVLKIFRNNKHTYIGSKYLVQRDIDAFIQRIGNIRDNMIIIVFGVAAGEHIVDLLKILKPNSEIIIFEPNLEVLDRFANSDNYNIISENKRIHILDLIDNNKKVLSNHLQKYDVNDIKFCYYANYPILFEKEFSEFKNLLRKIIFNKITQRDTLSFFSNILFKNFIYNLKDSKNIFAINMLKNLFTNKPVIIVSAGPSLEKNIHLLKEVQDKFIIICGARTLKPLTDIGVKPDFICAVDPQEATFNIMKENLNQDVPLVFMESANHELVKQYEGPKILFSNQGMESYLSEITGCQVDSLIQGGSVAHVCMGLAVYIGCSTIIFIGQDLAYTNDKFHAECAKSIYNPDDVSVSYYEINKDQWKSIKRENIYVDDVYGKKVRTSVILNSYREEFEDLIKECDGIAFINSTEGGSNIEGTRVMDLIDSISAFGSEDFIKDLKSVLDENNLLDKSLIANNLCNIKTNLQHIIDACKNGIRYSEQMYYYYSVNERLNIKKVFSELDKVDVVIGDIQKIGILAYLLSPYMEEILTKAEYVGKENETEKETGIRIALRCKALYQNIINASQEALGYL